MVIEQMMSMDLPRLGVFVGLAAIVGFFVMMVSIVGLIQWRKVRQAEMEGQLKMFMLERQMTAEEIATVIGAGRSKGFRDWAKRAKEWTCDHKGGR